MAKISEEFFFRDLYKQLSVTSVNPPFLKPSLFRLQNEQEKGGPWSQQLFEIPLWLMTDNALWYRVGGQEEGVSWRHYGDGHVFITWAGWSFEELSLFCCKTKFRS